MGAARTACTFTVVYCPVDGCVLDTPFKTAALLLEHLKLTHGIEMYDPDAVAPFIDRYLERCRSQLVDGLGLLGGDPDRFPHDADVRRELHMAMLKGLLQTQQLERATVHQQPRGCLFCSEQCADLADLFQHMFHEHRFNIGRLDNLVFVDAFLNALEELMRVRKQCIFCRESFRNGTCLRKHLKSKGHYRINAKDERWDRHYLVNYVNLSKIGGAANDPPDADADDMDEDGWEDLTDELDLQTQCLFCEELCEDPEGCFQHMDTHHSFNLPRLQTGHRLDFYQTLKLLNYLRHCQRYDVDPFVEDAPCNPIDTAARFGREELPDSRLWDRPEYYFPLYDDDPLLTAIDDGE